MHKEQFLAKVCKNKALINSKSQSYLCSLNTFPSVTSSPAISTKHLDLREKEYESIAEEATVQPVPRREKSAESNQLKSIASLSYRERIVSLEKDLERIRFLYISILNEKVKIEKDLIHCKKRNKKLEEKIAGDSSKIAEIDEFLEKFRSQQAKFESVSKLLVETTQKLKDIREQAEYDNKENLKIQGIYEERLKDLHTENRCLVEQIKFKDSACEKLKEEIERLNKIGNKDHQAKAVKALSNIILSKDANKPESPGFKIKNLESDYQNLLTSNSELLLKYRDLEIAHATVISSLKPNSLAQAQTSSEKPEILDLSLISNNSWVSSADSKTKDTDKDLKARISWLESQLESLRIKLELNIGNKEYLNFLQIQSSIIEDYLNEDSEIIQINSSLFSL